MQTTPSSDTIPHGLRYLSQVDLPAGASSITVDIPRGRMEVEVTEVEYS